MDRKQALLEASALLSSLRLGDAVILTVDGRELAVTVQGEHRLEDFGCGSWDQGAKTKLGYGPGRWNVSVSPAAIVAGQYAVRIAEGSE